MKATNIKKSRSKVYFAAAFVTIGKIANVRNSRFNYVILEYQKPDFSTVALHHRSNQKFLQLM